MKLNYIKNIQKEEKQIFKEENNFSELKQDLFNPKIEERYKNFKKSIIKEEKLKKYIYNLYNISISKDSSLIMSVICKIFVGEIVEKARELMSLNGLSGSITPKYYKIAYGCVIEDFFEF